jgi:protein-disulfide isomerase
MAAYKSHQDWQDRPFEKVKGQVEQAVKRARIEEARNKYMEHLREQASVSILLRPPQVKVGYDVARLRGNPQAPVIIVEFSDFQCPYCRQAEPTLQNLAAKYGGQVSLAYRDFPLREIHPNAQLAAEAARCAGEQGKFWDYHDFVFAYPNMLNRDGLSQQALNVGLNAKQFNSCLSSGKYRSAIEQDVQDGLKAGVEGTPGFFINGTMVSGVQSADEFDKVIRAELNASKEKRAAQ